MLARLDLTSDPDHSTHCPCSKKTMPFRMLGLLSAILLAGAPLSPALADDRAPTGEELGRIEAALRAEGYTAWEEIELDDGVWKVDDAVSGDGLKYDVVLDQSFAVIAVEEDGRDLSRRIR